MTNFIAERRHVDWCTAMHRACPGQRNSATESMPRYPGILLRWLSWSGLRIRLSDRTGYPVVLHPWRYLGTISGLWGWHKVINYLTHLIGSLTKLFRETRDGCDGCPGPFGGPRNRTAEAAGGGSNGNTNKRPTPLSNNKRPSGPRQGTGNTNRRPQGRHFRYFL